MSPSHEDLVKICDQINENCVSLFGQKFWESRLVKPVKILIKGDKFENRFFVISKFRVFILNGKAYANLKTEKCFNILALRQIGYTEAQEKLCLSWEERNGKTASIELRSFDDQQGDAYAIAVELLASFKHYFPDIAKSLSKLLSITPTHLLNVFPSLPVSIPALPCNNFRRSYVVVCDLMELGFRDEVIYDIERIYFTHGINDLNMSDFQHLTIPDQMALLSTIQYSAYFTGIIVDHIRLTIEYAEMLLTVVKRSHSLKTLKLINSFLPRDFLFHLAGALEQNSLLPLEHMELEEQNLDDRRAAYNFAIALSQIPTLHTIVLKNCSLGEKSFNQFVDGLYSGIGGSVDSANKSKPKLEVLNLAKNPADSNLTNLSSLVSLTGSTLKILDISRTGVHIDHKFWAALKFCGGHKLERLLLDGSFITVGKKNSMGGKDVLVIIRELFSMLPSLKEIDLTNAHISSEILNAILTGINSNDTFRAGKNSLRLVLDNSFGSNASDFVTILVENLSTCSVVDNISLRDNRLENEALRLIIALSQNCNIKSIDLGGTNFSTKKNSNVLKVLTELIRWASKEDSLLEEIFLRDCHLGASNLKTILSALGFLTRLKHLDIRNNEIGNYGSRLLSKSLQLNNSLRVLAFDQNQISYEGYCDISRALDFNKTLISIPYPIHDMAEAFARSEPTRLVSTFAEIDEKLKRNQHLAFLNNEEALNTMSESSSHRIMHALNNNCDKYHLNESEVKKIAFHKITKAVSELRDQPCSELIDWNSSLENSFKSFTDKLESAHIDINKLLRSQGIEADLDVDGSSSINVQDLPFNILADQMQILAKCYMMYVSASFVLRKNIIGQ